MAKYTAEFHADPVAVFAEKVLPRVEVTPTDCWIFTGGAISTGYGAVRGGNQVITTHRLSVLASGRALPAGMTVDHTCHDSSECFGGSCIHRRCVNPDHLEVVTQGENNARRWKSGRCSRGHELDRQPDGKRRCDTCRSIYREARSAAAREARS